MFPNFSHVHIMQSLSFSYISQLFLYERVHVKWISLCWLTSYDYLLTAILANLISLVPGPLWLPLIGSSLPPSQEEHKPKLACQPIFNSALFEAIGRTYVCDCMCVCVYVCLCVRVWVDFCMNHVYSICIECIGSYALCARFPECWCLCKCITLHFYVV